jgi:hypothetical protein
LRKSFSWKRLLLATVLEFAALTGAPLRPEDIEQALRSASTTAVEEQTRDDAGDPPGEAE